METHWSYWKKWSGQETGTHERNIMGKSLKDSIQKAKAILGGKEEETLMKGCHDAMYHHAIHSKAADRAGKRDAAKEHMSKLLEHAVSHAKKKKNPHDMKYGLQRAVDHFYGDASDELGWGDDADNHDAVKHFKGGGCFVPHGSDHVANGKKKKIKKSAHERAKDWLQKSRVRN